MKWTRGHHCSVTATPSRYTRNTVTVVTALWQTQRKVDCGGAARNNADNAEKCGYAKP
ncbi:hypothetical protein PSAC2689_30102 [Paraburkholderia sacchari]